MNNGYRAALLPLAAVLVVVLGGTLGFAVAAEVNTAVLSQNGWFSDATRADGTGTEAAGTNLISDTLTDEEQARWTRTSRLIRTRRSVHSSAYPRWDRHRRSPAPDRRS